MVRVEALPDLLPLIRDANEDWLGFGALNAYGCLNKGPVIPPECLYPSGMNSEALKLPYPLQLIENSSAWLM
jgi:hypothetical protein